MKKSDLQYLIKDGKLDSVLDELALAVRERRKELWERDRDEKARETLDHVGPGARVELCDLRPKYLNGIAGVVQPFVKNTLRKRKGVVMIPVLLDYSPGGRFSSKNITVPASCLKVVDPLGAGK